MVSRLFCFMPRSSMARVIPVCGPGRCWGAACLLLFQTAVIPHPEGISSHACEHQELRLLQQAVSTVPEGASVTACLLVAPLSQREELYELKYHPSPDTDYLVLDLRPAYRSESLQEARPFREAGYENRRLLGRRRGNSPGAVGSGFLTDRPPS